MMKKEVKEREDIHKKVEENMKIINSEKEFIVERI